MTVNLVRIKSWFDRLTMTILLTKFAAVLICQ